MPKVVRPIILKGPGQPKRKWSSQLQRDTPVGSFTPAEYHWGAHALATHVAEGLKSHIFASVVGAAVVLTAVPTFVYARQESYPEGTQSFVRPPAVAGATPRPIPLLGGAPQGADLTLQASIFRPLTSPQGPTVRPVVGGPLPVDLTQQGSITKPTPSRQSGVPPFTLGSSQADPSQLAAIFTPSQPAAAITPNPIAGFFVVPPQTEERPTRSIWPAQVAGSTTSVIALTSGAPQVWDFTQQALVVGPAWSVPPVSYGFTMLYAAPQVYDFTQQAVLAVVQDGTPPPPDVTPAPVSVGGGSGIASCEIQDRYWREVEKRYKKKKKQAEKKSERAVELVEQIAERGTDLTTAVEALKTDLAEENIKQQALYVELLKLKLELAQADEEEEEAVMIAAMYS